MLIIFLTAIESCIEVIMLIESAFGEGVPFDDIFRGAGPA